MSRYRLDIGEGKEINLERCPRPKLQKDCIKYLGPVSVIFIRSATFLICISNLSIKTSTSRYIALL